ncbi:MAG: rod shape-determining protein RodA [Fimbriimonadaceae bacterium]
MSTTALPGMRQGTLGSEDGPRHLRYWVMGFALVILIFGLVSLFAIQRFREESFFSKQLLFLAVGTVAFVGCRRLRLDAVPHFVPVLYGINILSLIAIFFIGDERNGATRWIDIGPLQFQPSEMAKILFILTLSSYWSKPDRDPKQLSSVFGSLLHTMPIAALIFLQPHLGGATSIMVIWAVITVASGAKWRHILLIFMSLALLASTLLLGYQKERILAMVNPEQGGNAYQQTQAAIAFANGGVFGEGFMNGEQTRGGYVPFQETDFIYSAVGEQFGLFGATIVLFAFLGMFFTMLLIARSAQSPMGRNVAMGVLGVLAFHTIANIGMVIGVTPVVGLWLPLMSYGGTALIICIAMLGLVMAVR